MVLEGLVGGFRCRLSGKFRELNRRFLPNPSRIFRFVEAGLPAFLSCQGRGGIGHAAIK